MSAYGGKAGYRITFDNLPLSRLNIVTMDFNFPKAGRPVVKQSPLRFA
jgi:hypothetical protein